MNLLPSVRDNVNLPAAYEAAKEALMTFDKVDECKEWADAADAAAYYGRQSKNKELEIMALRIRLRAIRRIGELLMQIKSQKGGGKKLKGTRVPFSRETAAKKAGLTLNQAKTAMRIARVSGHTFEKQVESEVPPPVKEMAAQGLPPKKYLTPQEVFIQSGMTKKVFQAGMYFRGDVRSYLKSCEKYELQDIVDGTYPEDRAKLKNDLLLIEKFQQQLKTKL